MVEYLGKVTRLNKGRKGKRGLFNLCLHCRELGKNDICKGTEGVVNINGSEDKEIK
jgi:hypothetical protein